MSVIGKLAALTSTARARGLPGLDQEILRRHLADVVVARMAGARTGEGRALAALERRRARPAPSQSWRRRSGSPRSTISTSARARRLLRHVPVALALAAKGDCEPARVLGAIWAGTELVVRLGKAIDGAQRALSGHLADADRCAVGAAAVACRMWGLDETKTAHALSLALMMTPARIARFTGALSGRWILFAARQSATASVRRRPRVTGFPAIPRCSTGRGWEKMLGRAGRSGTAHRRARQRAASIPS